MSTDNRIRDVLGNELRLFIKHQPGFTYAIAHILNALQNAGLIITDVDPTDAIEWLADNEGRIRYSRGKYKCGALIINEEGQVVPVCGESENSAVEAIQMAMKECSIRIE